MKTEELFYWNLMHLQKREDFTAGKENHSVWTEIMYLHLHKVIHSFKSIVSIRNQTTTRPISWWLDELVGRAQFQLIDRVWVRFLINRIFDLVIGSTIWSNLISISNWQIWFKWKRRRMQKGFPWWKLFMKKEREMKI